MHNAGRTALRAFSVRLALGLWVGSVGCSGAAPTGASSMQGACADDATDAFEVLVFSKTAGFRHPSIEDGVAAICELGMANGFGVRATEDAAAFTADPLEGYAVIVFLNTTGDVLDGTEQGAFEAYIRAGGGFVGIHSATDTEYDWAWYGGLVGAYFQRHPAVQEATVRVEDRDHPSTVHLPVEWTRRDEWYDFRANPRAEVNVLATVDETTYADGGMGADHPIAWYHLYDGGRSWYTAGGHTEAAYSEPLFRQHLLGGILWAADAAP